MVRKLAPGILAVILVVGGVLAVNHPAASAGSQKLGGMLYASLPDEAALYLNDIVFVRDTVVLPAEDVRVLLPPGTYVNTLILSENGERVHTYRVTPQASEAYYSQVVFGSNARSYAAGGTAYILTWVSPSQATSEQTREVTLEYLMSGASWTPTYDMRIMGDQTVKLAFFAEIHSSALLLDSTTVYLLAGRVDLSQQINQVSQVTMNQYAVGYANETVSLPALGVGTVTLQHIYSLGPVDAEPGDTLYANLADAALPARRLYAWNASQDQQVNVIYKVTNSTEIPLAEGIVRTYQDGLFMGSDFVETTPVGSEGSVTVGSLPDVRVRRTESQEYHGEVPRSYYQHSVTLEIHNFSQEDLPLIALDTWSDNAWQFEYSMEPQRQQDNLLRWEVNVAAGDSLTITYQFRTY
jgi:hypothetical protein